MFCSIRENEVAVGDAIHRDCAPRASCGAAVVFNMAYIVEGIAADGGDAVGDGDGGQAAAAIEGSVADGGNKLIHYYAFFICKKIFGKSKEMCILAVDLRGGQRATTEIES